MRGGCGLSSLVDVVDLEAKVLRVLKNEVLRSMPAGVGMREWWLMAIEEVELGIPVFVRRLLKVFEVSLVRASEKEDFRWLVCGRFGICCSL